MRKEILFTNLAKDFNIDENKLMQQHKWKTLNYRTPEFDGTMIVGFGKDKNLTELVLDPKLEGIYAINIGLAPLFDFDESGIIALDAKLSCDEFYNTLYTANGVPFSMSKADFDNAEKIFNEEANGFCIDEVFWKTADMTGQKLIFKKPEGDNYSGIIALIRFTPIDTDAKEDILLVEGGFSRKHLYISDDIDNMYADSIMPTEETFRQRVETFKRCGAAKMSLEFITNIFPSYTGELNHLFYNNSVYLNRGNTGALLKKQNIDPLKIMIEQGHKNGIEMYLSLRTGLWSSTPFGQMFYNEFYDNHPELRTIDRDGTEVARLSYAYQETRDYVISLLERMAEYDCDGIDLLFNRNIPFVLFEQPLLDRVYKKYGIDARTLPHSDKRLIDVKCEIMTEFIKEVKSKLNTKRTAIGKNELKISVHIFRNIDASKLIGLDVERWVAENLVDNVIFYPMRFFENLPDEVITDDGLIDVDKYKTYMMEHPGNVAWCIHKTTGIEYDFIEPNDEKIKQMAELSKRGNATIYVDVMPRECLASEVDEMLTRLEKLGIQNIALWDAQTRLTRRRQWLVYSQFGCENKVDYKKLYKTHQLISLDGQNIDRYPSQWGG